jgi:hypothetical protein
MQFQVEKNGDESSYEAMVITYDRLALLNAQLNNKQPIKCTHLNISLK